MGKNCDQIPATEVVEKSLDYTLYDLNALKGRN